MDRLRENALERGENRGPKEYAGLAARGFCMGSADVVPGVSGGTMAFILGIYEELIGSIRMAAQPEFLRALRSFRFREAFRIINLDFLLAVGLGIMAAILSFARAIEWLLENHPVYLWSFFFGLVLASVLTVARRITEWNPALWIALVAGAAFAYLLVGLVPLQTPDTWWFLALSGAIAICAMILPGISGAFVLVLLGKYQYILAALNDRDLATIAVFAAGAGIGIVTFAQFLGWLFRKYHDPTVALLTGLMLGSLRKVWPWKVDLEWVTSHEGEKIVTVQQNILPSWGGPFMLALVLMAVGLASVVLLDRWANRVQGDDLRPGS